MKKIIFVFLLFYSSLVFSFNLVPLPDYVHEFDARFRNKVVFCSMITYFYWFTSGPVIAFFIQDFNTGINYKSNVVRGYCLGLGWIRQLKSYYIIDSSTNQLPPILSDNYYYVDSKSSLEKIDVTPDCILYHSARDVNFDPKRCFLYGSTNHIFSSQYEDYFVIKYLGLDPKIALQVAETTIKKLNKLKAEENSKLGSIANSEATETSLWAKIFDAFKNLVLPTPTPTPTPPPVIDPLPTPPPEEVAVPLSNTPLNLQVSPLISGGVDCPTSNRITVFAHDYSISNEPFCDLARGVRSIVIASAQVGAAWLILGAL